MPQVDGIGLLKEIKSQEPEINVVMVSGHGNIHTAVTATKFGAFDFLEKPVSLEGLLLTVQRALGESSNTEAQAKPCQEEDAAAKRRRRSTAAARGADADDQTKDLEKKRRALRPRTSFGSEDRIDSSSAAAQQRNSIHRHLRRSHCAGAFGLCRLHRLRDLVAFERIRHRHRRAFARGLALLWDHQSARQSAGRSADHGRLGAGILPGH